VPEKGFLKTCNIFILGTGVPRLLDAGGQGFPYGQLEQKRPTSDLLVGLFVPLNQHHYSI